MICHCDYDAPEFWHQAFPVARITHRCEECGRSILPGEKYERVSGKWNGCIDFFKTCRHCVDVRQFVQNSVPCFCWAHGNLAEDVRITIEDAYDRAPDEVRGLRTAVGRIVIAGKRFAAEATT